MPHDEATSQCEAVNKMLQALRGLETEQGRLAGLTFKPAPGDVILSTPPKCGTTLVCQILQSLRSGGDMNFEEINLVIPCLEMAWDYGYRDLDAPQGPPPGWLPRIYKTHAWYHHTPKGNGVRYIHVLRNPLDAFNSFYYYFRGWFFDADASLSLDDFISEFCLQRGAPTSMMQNASIFHNLTSWYPHRKDPDVLLLFYEDIIADLAGAVERIADFLGLGRDDPALCQLAVQQAHIDHMKQHPTKYDEHMLKNARNAACGLPARAGLDGSSSGKVRQGGVGNGVAAVSAAVLKEVDAKWQEVVLPVTGYKNYEELRMGVNAELGR